MALTKVTYSMIQGAVANVLDYGAKGDGVTDDTAAFNAAIATGKKVYVPITTNGYVVNDIAVITNMVIEGEKSGIRSGPLLIVSKNNSSAFTVTTQAFQIEISNFIINAASGVTGARAYKQLDKTYYTAYAKFTGIETSSKLAVSYDLFPIFTVWSDCRDAYIDAALAQGHQAINAIPASWSQGNQTNINRIVDSSFWGANGSDCAGTNVNVALLDIAYGETWTIENTDFEGPNIPAIRARGISNFQVKNSRFEGIRSDKCVISDITPSNPIGSGMYFANCAGALGFSTGYFAFIGAASFIEVSGGIFTQVPNAITLANIGAYVRNAFNINVVGAGAAGFLTGVNTVTVSGGKMLINGAVDTGTASPVQLSGIFTSSGGVTTLPTQVVTTASVAIATVLHGAQLVFVKITNNSGGNGGWYLLAVTSSNGNITTISSYTAILGITPTFSAASGVLSISFASGSGTVSTALLV